MISVYLRDEREENWCAPELGRRECVRACMDRCHGLGICERMREARIQSECSCACLVCEQEREKEKERGVRL